MAKFLISLGICLFWNGIVSAIAITTISDMAEAGQINVLETLFLSPFVIVGIGMLILVFTLALDPVRKTTYSFSNREVSWTRSYFGIPFSRTKSVVGRVKMELDLYEEIGIEHQLFDGLLGINFFENEELIFYFSSLTLAEAEWISTRIEQEQEMFDV